MLTNFDRYFDLKVLYHPDPPGGTGLEDPPADPPIEKTFTQAEVDKFIERRLASVKRENDKSLKTLQDQINAVNLQNKELLEKLDSHNPPNPNPPSKELQGQLELQQKKHDRELEAFRKEIDELKTVAQDEKRKRMDTELKKLIQDALSKSGCRDLLAGERYFLPQIQWDEVENQYIFNTKKGSVLSIEDGIQDELPDYMRSPAMQGGGSGARSGGTRNSEKRRMLEQEKAKLVELKTNARKNGGKSEDVVQVTRQQRKVAELEAQLSST